MEHSFNIEIAQKYGIKEAVIIQNIHFWILKNAANGKHIYDGRVWTYNSVKAWQSLLPYMTKDQIRRTIEHLESSGAIITGEFNNSAYDRTKWYSLPETITDTYGTTNNIIPVELSNLPNGNAQNAKPIPDNKPDNKLKERYTLTGISKESAHPRTDTTRFSAPSVNDVKDYCQERNNSVDAQRFVDFYASKGWMVGTNHMKDWKAAVRTWEKGDGRNGRETRQYKNPNPIPGVERL